MSLLRRVRNVARYYLKPPEHLTHTGSDLLADFIDQCRMIDAPKVLELGTRRSYAERSTRHDSWIPHASKFIGADIELAEDVDIVVDAHRLTETTGHEEFDAVISCSSFEHFKYPHLAAHEIMKAMKIGGLLFIQTHQSYPLHASPHDYFRFSREALSGLFGTRMGFEVIATDFEFPVRLKAKESSEVSFMPAYLNTRLFGKKVSTTPDEYIYDYDIAI
ncbi:MAG: hypothetical protein DMF63_14880 [Acidobacteria bacterium]|nr:MAG: hypothetical protein DMF63_14880 [Acidobacteriota bacterium]